MLLSKNQTFSRRSLPYIHPMVRLIQKIGILNQALLNIRSSELQIQIYFLATNDDDETMANPKAMRAKASTFTFSFTVRDLSAHQLLDFLLSLWKTVYYYNSFELLASFNAHNILLSDMLKL